MEDVIAKTVRAYEKSSKDYKQKHTTHDNLKSLEFFASLAKGKRLLDIGSGSGRDAKYFYEQGFQVTCIDLSKKLLQLVKKVVPKAKCKLMDMRFLTFKTTSFDGIWASASFLHVPKNQGLKTIKGFKRVLKRRGVLYLGVKQGKGEKLISKNYYNGEQKFFAFYTLKELENLVKESGMLIEKSGRQKNGKQTFVYVFARKK